MKTKLKAWVKLLSAPEISRTKVLRLVRTLGEPTDFLQNHDSFRDLTYLSDAAVSYLSSAKDPLCWKECARLTDRFNIRFLTILDDDYPEELKSIYDPPPILFYRGEYQPGKFRRTFAVVGTRKPSCYGKTLCSQLTAGLSKAGFTIISGLAYGIDTEAHISAVNNGGYTIAVLGTGVEQVYPSGNKKLADSICANGILLSEYIPGSKPERWYFPERNRIISGLCLGCLIIEGSRRSGALLTAKFALDQNRDIFALPGDVNRPQAEGPNFLIKQGAKPVTCVDDILEEYDLILSSESNEMPSLTESEKEIYEILTSRKPFIQFDELVIKSGRSPSELAPIVLALELKNLLRKEAGNKLIALV